VAADTPVAVVEPGQVTLLQIGATVVAVAEVSMPVLIKLLKRQPVLETAAFRSPIQLYLNVMRDVLTL
jgi:hypothetical protein